MIGISKHCPESGKAPQHLREPWLLLLHEHQVQIHLRSCPHVLTQQKLANDLNLKGVLMLHRTFMVCLETRVKHRTSMFFKSFHHSIQLPSSSASPRLIDCVAWAPNLTMPRKDLSCLSFVSFSSRKYSTETVSGISPATGSSQDLRSWRRIIGSGKNKDLKERNLWITCCDSYPGTLPLKPALRL